MTSKTCKTAHTAQTAHTAYIVHTAHTAHNAYPNLQFEKVRVQLTPSGSSTGWARTHFQK